MRWQTGRRSTNIEDRRGIRTSSLAGGGIGMVLLALAAYYFGIDPRVVLDATDSVKTETVVDYQPSPEEQQLAEFVSVVLGETEETWQALFKSMGKQYQEPTLVLFSDAVKSACGFAEAAVGPFYCSLDQKVYIDLKFYDELKNRFKAPGDFAQAYVVAHEVGHHVQNLLGITKRMQETQTRGSQAEGNQLSVRLELQADCLAGLWANHTQARRKILEAGDVEEALGAAASIGDDRLQKQTRGVVVPDSFTHGTSAQRVRWFQRGLDSTSMESCNTFAN